MSGTRIFRLIRFDNSYPQDTKVYVWRAIYHCHNLIISWWCALEKYKNHTYHRFLYVQESQNSIMSGPWTQVSNPHVIPSPLGKLRPRSWLLTNASGRLSWGVYMKMNNLSSISHNWGMLSASRRVVCWAFHLATGTKKLWQYLLWAFWISMPFEKAKSLIVVVNLRNACFQDSIAHNNK